MSRVSLTEYNRQLLLFIGFLGAIAVAALVLVIQSPGKFEPFIQTPGAPIGVGYHLHAYFAALVAALTVVAVCSVFGGYSMAVLGAKDEEAFSKFDFWLFVFAVLNLSIALLALLVAIPLMVLPSSPKGAEYIVIFEGIIGGLFFVILTLRNREARKIQAKELCNQQSAKQETPSSE